MTTENSYLCVTFVEQHGKFIKIWGQTDRTGPAIIKKSLLEMTPHFDQAHYALTFDKIHIGKVLYLVKYIDNVYYRVFITNVVQQNLVEVHFIDFGNKEFVPLGNLRIIPTLSQGVIMCPPQAKDFILGSITYRDSVWDPRTLSLISNEIRFTEATYSVINRAANLVIIKLFTNQNEDFAISLFNRGLVLSIALNAQLEVLLGIDSSAAASMSAQPILTMERRTPPFGVPPASNQSIPGLAFKVSLIEPNKDYNVYISYVCDGPYQFSVQLQKSEDNLAKLMKELNTVTLQPLKELPKPGTVCVAKCLEDDHICRAVVTNLLDTTSYKVFYVDFGNSEVVPMANLFQIPMKYVLPKVMATRCTLAGLDKINVTIEMKCAFKKYVCDKLLCMRVLPSEPESLVLCNLYDQEGINVLDILEKGTLLAYPTTTQLTRGFSQEVHVSYVHSCSRFYVQIKGREQELTNLMISLQTVCTNAPKLETVKVGLPCCALFEDDKKWYRAQVTRIENVNITVRYVDYGNEAHVRIDHLVRPPGEIITKFRPQAIECCLNGYQNFEDDLGRDHILEQLILENDFTMKVIDMQSSKALVDLMDPSNYNIGYMLLEKIGRNKSQIIPNTAQENNQIEQQKRRSFDESSNRHEHKPLRDQNERGFDRQDSWRQQKPERKEENFDSSSNVPAEKPWRETVKNSHIDTFDKPQDSFGKPLEKRDGFKKNSWNEDDSGSNWRSNKEDGNKKDSWDEENSSGSNWKSNKEDDFKKDSWNEYNSDSKWKSNKEDGFKKNSLNKDNSGSNWKSNKDDENKQDNNWGVDNSNSKYNNRDRFNKDYKYQRDGDSGWKSKPKEDGGWTNSQRNELSFNKFNNNRNPRENTWSSTDGASSNNTQNTVTNPAPFTSPFILPDVLNHNEKVILSWFHDPAHFFCQLFDSQAEFKTMMDDIQTHYCNIKSGSAPLGASVIARFPDDGVMYRAQVLELLGSQYRVQYIDFGNVSMTDKVWPVENKFMKLPVQAICCSLNGIIPLNESWPDTSLFSCYFNKEYFYCQFMFCNDSNYIVDLTSDNITSMSGTLVADNLAQYAAAVIYDPTILLRQQIKVTVNEVQGLHSFNLKLPNGELLPCAMHNLLTATETFEDTLKQFIENCVLMYVDNVLEDRLEVTLYDTVGVKLKIIEPDEGAYETVDIPCPLPVLYSTISGHIPHIEKLEDNTQYVYIQFTEHTPTLELLLENMFKHYEENQSKELIQPEVGAIYAVHSSDTNWYRGEVKSVEDESVVVTFIDYGNSETVGKTELQNLAAEFLETHVLCLRVSAAGDDELIDNEVTGTVWYGENGWEAELKVQPVGEQVEGELLASTAVPASTEEPNEAELKEEVPADQLIEETIQVIGVPVILSHIDSPSEFYLQQSYSLETIDNLQATLQEQVLEFPNLETPTAGIICAAPYSVNQHWYRAIILDADEDITTVRFVDFGNTDVITNNTTNVKTLPPELLSLEQYARRSSLMLEPNGPEWSTTAFERFEHLTGIDNLTVEILHQDEKTTYVRLFANGVDVAEILTEETLGKKLQIEIESSSTGYVSNLNSPSEFWIQLENSVADLEWIAEQLSLANNFAELEDLTPGSLCAALFNDDEMWYRARILSNTVAGLEVLFIDYGNSCTCISLRQLPEDLIMLAPLAQKCSLQKPSGILQWSQKANEQFKMISAYGATVFSIDKVSTGETYVVRLLLNGEDISNTLLPVTEDAYISHIDSLTSFWMQKVKDIPKLDKINDTLTGASDWPVYEDSQENCLVAALSSEEVWYRAQIISKNNDFEVLFIDYGNTGIVKDVRVLKCDLDKEPQLATKCRLDPLPGFRWSEQSFNILIEINSQGSTLFEVEFVGEEVVRLYSSRNDIRSKLESIPISSVPNTPKKEIVKPSIDTILLYNDSAKGVAESIVNNIVDCVNNETQYDSTNNIDDTVKIVNSAHSHIEGEEDPIPTNDNDFYEIILDSTDSAKLATHIEENDHLVNSQLDELQRMTTDENNTNKICALEDSNSATAESNSELSKKLEDDTPPSTEETQDKTLALNKIETDHIEAHSVEEAIHKEAHSPDNNKEWPTLKRRLSIPHAEKVVPGFYNCELTKINHESEETLLHDEAATQANSDEDILQKTLNRRFIAHEDKVVPGFCSNKLIQNNMLIHDEATSYNNLTEQEHSIINRSLPIPHAEKVVPGFCSNKLLETNNCQSEGTVDENLDQFDLQKLLVTNRCSPIPHAEKVVPGFYNGGEAIKTQLDDDLSLHTNLEDDHSLQNMHSDPHINLLNVAGVDEPKSKCSLSNMEKIVPGSISCGDMSVSKSECSNEEVGDKLLINQSDKESTMVDKSE